MSTPIDSTTTTTPEVAKSVHFEDEQPPSKQEMTVAEKALRRGAGAVLQLKVLLYLLVVVAAIGLGSAAFVLTRNDENADFATSVSA